MKKKILISGIVIIFISIILFIIYKTKVEVSLNGKQDIDIPYGVEYEDDGFTIKKGGKKLKGSKYHYDFQNDVDVYSLGDYKISYDIKYHGKKYKLERNIHVKDLDEPDILSSDTILRDYCTKENKEPLEYKALDNYDGDITDKVDVTEEDENIILSVTDSNGNEALKKIKIVYEEIPEDSFHLNGNDVIYIEKGFGYSEEGASLTDGCGNNIDADIKIEGSVDTNTDGEYTITYTLDDKVLTRKVVVQTIVRAPKTIYLTFDDGPGYYTESILSTLDKYGVKATFFVTNQFPNFQYLIGEEYKRGHKVAVHTYSHNYNIYSSVDTYINDFNSMNEIIKSYTGSYSNLFRFPGGSSNTISRNYSYGVVSAVASEMTRLGYVYFDWNVESGDASGLGSTDIYYRVVNGTDNCSSCVILMHDIKQTTANALDSILYTLTKRGYTFATLNEYSETAHHRIAN